MTDNEYSATKRPANRDFLAYQSWRSMRQRCLNPKSDKYLSYGGRGIRICARWATFSAFLEDMGEKPSPAHTIDRNDNDGDYCPENCRWATKSEQSRNRNYKPRGETHPSSRLTENEVLAMRERAAVGEPHLSLAECFGISKDHAISIVTGRRWASVGGPRTLQRGPFMMVTQ